MAVPQMNGHEARRLRTRQAILRSAHELFDEQGYAPTTVAQIVRRAEVSERTFYLHFPAKEDVLFAHVQDFIQLAWRVADETDSAAPVVRVRAAILALIDAASRDDDVARNARLRATLGVSGNVPRSLAAQLMTLAGELARRVAEATSTPVEAVAPMVGAALGAVEAAGLVGAGRPGSPKSRRDAMIRALDAALRGFHDD